jgi:hypothetical protein
MFVLQNSVNHHVIITESNRQGVVPFVDSFLPDTSNDPSSCRPWFFVPAGVCVYVVISLGCLSVICHRSNSIISVFENCWEVLFGP